VTVVDFNNPTKVVLSKTTVEFYDSVDDICLDRLGLVITIQEA
jgi:hypothetical protein